MKVALIGDVHANLPALEAVLEHAKRYGVDEIWNLGDFVGYGAFPDEVVKKLKKLGAISVIGNYDRKVLKVKEKSEDWQKSKHPLKYFSFRWTFDQLSRDSLEYLRDLPLERKLEVADKKILLVHASPESIKEHLDSETPEKRLKELAKRAKADVVVCGHSHRPFFREADNVFFINPGSVGRSDLGDPRACYAILQIKPGSFQIHHHRIEYNIEKAIAGIRKNKLPEEFIEMLKLGRTLNEVLENKDSKTKAKAPEAEEKESENQLEAVMDLAKKSAYEADHAHQVTRLALLLYDQLSLLHGMGPRARFLLECGAILHDIGWIEGQEGHHKRSYKIIMKEDLPFKKNEKKIIALVARYHRKNVPDPADEELKDLEEKDLRTIQVLAGIVRVADGLDRSHEDVVQNLAVKISPEEIIIQCEISDSAQWEKRGAEKKGDLLKALFNRSLTFKFKEV